MHKIVLKNNIKLYISSDKFQFYYNLWNKEKRFIVNNNAIDCFNIKGIYEVTIEEEMINKLLDKESSYVQKKVEEFISWYYLELTIWVVENMILKAKS